MFFFSKIAIVLYTCAFTLYIFWGFTTITSNLLQVFFTQKINSQPIIAAALYMFSLAIVEKITPKFFKKYNILSLYLLLALLPWWGWSHTIKTKHSMGDLLFASQSASKVIYLAIPLTLYSLWLIYRNFITLVNKTEQTPNSYILRTGINRHLWSICIMLALLSVNIYYYVFTLQSRLEIRDKGIFLYVSSPIVWQDIIDYSWSENQSNQLIIQYLNVYRKEVESKIAIAPEEKKQIENIFKDKLSSISE